MKSIEVRNVNEALGEAIPYLLTEGLEETSRNGTVLVAPTPVCTTYRRPTERVVFGSIRDANPFFHLMEALWMLAGRNDLTWPVRFNKRFTEYSDNGETIHGAYGFRWREFFFFDQLQEIVQHLKETPTSRRAVLTMWSPEGDLIPNRLRPYAFGTAGTGGTRSKDVPCNTHAYFDIRGGVLNMTVCNRSNDVIWGAYGANIVHFSMLQEYIALRVGVGVGVYRQISNNFHVYTDVYNKEKLRALASEAALKDYYLTNPNMCEFPLMSVPVEDWHQDLSDFMERKFIHAYKDEFFSQIAEPVYQAWEHRRIFGAQKAIDLLENEMPNCDWKIACIEWIKRREENKNAA